ncbi:hypothetical protein [Candidatus Poriferisodalis sp.]|uniref:hypothetical protein n=1 Tax=Candidatus Poriferisodalis sp. TaxID=3101277 RepID=UPI003B01D6E4
MNALPAAAEPAPHAEPAGIEAVLANIAEATNLHDFEQAWIAGLRTPAAGGPVERDTILAAAGCKLRSLGESQDDLARRGWLRHIAEEAQLRSGGELGIDLAARATTELREAFAFAAGDLVALRESILAGNGLRDAAASQPSAADRVRDLGRIAEALCGSGLLALCAEEDVDLARRLAQAMRPPIHLVPVVPEALQVSRDDLLRWYTPDRAAQLPRLIRNLIAETEPTVEWSHFPAGSGVSSPGWDGIVRCTRGNRYVPPGASVWEVTTQQGGTNAKAKADYLKRVDEYPADERRQLTYVAVACAPWTKAQHFVAEHSNNGDFDSVRALNVDDLEDWLSCALRTTVWLREQIGIPIAGVMTLAAWWHRWRASTTTPIDERIVLAGRKESADKLREQCKHQPGVITIGGPFYPDEIIAFVAAAIEADGAESDNDGAQIIYVDDHDTALQLFATEAVSLKPQRAASGPVLTVMVPSREFAKHLHAGSPHRMIVPVPGSTQADIVLSAVDSSAVAQQLRATGFEPREAHEFGNTAGVSLIALRRQLAEKPELYTPDWATQHIDQTLRRCLLVGGWNETCAGDLEIVGRLTGAESEQVAETLRALDRADAPFVEFDRTWCLVSPADSWILLREHLTRSDVDAFSAVAHDVLTTAEPLRELASEDLLRAALDGIKAKFSTRLRRSVATTLALAGSLEPATDAGKLAVLDLARDITLRVLKSANEDPTHKTWTAVAEVLPLLGEADPDAVLQTLRTCLSMRHQFVEVMFAGRDAMASAFGGHPPYHYVLETLEIIAWSPEHLVEVVDLLAKLDGIHAGHRDGRRPLDALEAILWPWSPRTAADAHRRLQAVELLRRRYPGLAWELVLSMLSDSTSSRSVWPQPRYRHWRQALGGVTRQEKALWDDSLAPKLIEDAGIDPERWYDVLRHVDRLPVAIRSQAITGLKEQLASAPDEQFASSLWPQLRRVAAEHRQHRNAYWALPDSDLELLEQLRDESLPADPGIAYGHLFTQGASCLDGVSRTEQPETLTAALNSKQDDAVAEVLSRGDLEAVLRFASTVDAPSQVGEALARRSPTHDAALLQLIGTPDARRADTAAGYFMQRYEASGWDGIEQLLSHHETSAQASAELLRMLRPAEAPWTRADALGADIATEYWHRVGFSDLAHLNELSDLLTVSRRLREAGRVGFAVELLEFCGGFCSDAHTSAPEFVEEACVCLEQWITRKNDHDDGTKLQLSTLTSLLQVIAQHHEYLGTRRVAILEWQYGPLLGANPKFETLNLHRELARDPKLFVDLVELAFKPANDQQDPTAEPDDAGQCTALNAFESLHSWPDSTFAPGLGETDELGGEALAAWVNVVHESLAKSGRDDIGKRMIGVALAASPADANGDWPGLAVRTLLEELECDQVDSGLSEAMRNRRINQRGPEWRDIAAGGEQEHRLAAGLKATSQHFAAWPRTAAILREVGRSYRYEALVRDTEREWPHPANEEAG